MTTAPSILSALYAWAILNSTSERLHRYCVLLLLLPTFRTLSLYNPRLRPCCRPNFRPTIYSLYGTLKKKNKRRHYYIIPIVKSGNERTKNSNLGEESEARGVADFGDQTTMGDAPAQIPTSFGHELRACLRCRLVKTYDQVSLPLLSLSLSHCVCVFLPSFVLMWFGFPNSLGILGARIVLSSKWKTIMSVLSMLPPLISAGMT